MTTSNADKLPKQITWIAKCLHNHEWLALSLSNEVTPRRCPKCGNNYHELRIPDEKELQQ